jgi:ribosomal protein S18 acetylase RimI-like enzyme
MNTEILKWDSEFFGFRTARILSSDLDEKQLFKTLENLRARNTRLVYWASQAQVDFDVHTLGGRLVDKKAIFESDLRQTVPLLTPPYAEVVRYTNDIPQQIMMDLAVQAGEFSRFARDPQFPRDRFIALYLEWMRKSLTGEMADAVLVALADDIPAGMVTLSAQEGVGDIGLIAVDTAFRGQHLGISLMTAARNWYLEQKLKRARVVTQADNQAACRLYQHCGYKMIQMEFFYHFWLEPEQT